MLGFTAYLRTGRKGSGVHRAAVNVCTVELQITALNISLGYFKADNKAGRKLSVTSPSGRYILTPATVSATLKGLSRAHRRCPVHRSHGAANDSRDKAETRRWEGWVPSAELAGGHDLRQPSGSAHKPPSCCNPSHRLIKVH